MRSELFEEAWKQNRHVWESTKCLAQAMYLAGEQHQQSKVDELKLKLSEYSRILHNVIEIERKKNDELQKRVDAAQKLLEKWKTTGLNGTSDYAVGGAHARQNCEDELEQALKGGEA